MLRIRRLYSDPYAGPGRLLWVALMALGLSSTGLVSAGESVAPMLEGMGDHHHPISTDNPTAQKYFDQGLVLAYGFNHLEAERSFREAARLDPECAMCYWGIAFVRGPNINSMMDPENVPVALEAMRQAEKYAPHASAAEQAFIKALSIRYVEDPPEDRSELDTAYANAMRQLSTEYPDDLDSATLFAASLMDTTPWDYWTEDGKPREITNEILEVLERVIAKNPKHPGAIHFYIHAVEKVRPELAADDADRLRDLTPGAGHLVHMPSHIYLRVGRYHDATIANQKAVLADDGYVTQCRQQGLYPLVYMPHNWHFLWYAAMMEGRREVAMDAARQMSARIDHDKMRLPGLGGMQHFWITPLYGFIQFGLWDDILLQPAPPEDLIYPRAVWHYARGTAYTRLNDLASAQAELSALAELAKLPDLELVTIWDLNSAAALMDIAVEVLGGDIAAMQGDLEEAATAYETAIELEDELTYDEPPPWYKPVRQIYGAALLEADRATEAEAIYRADLEKFRGNGWSLFGLQLALAAQGKTDEAQEVAKEFEKAWQYADTELSSSRF